MRNRKRTTRTIRSDEAAARVYRIIEALHTQGQALVPIVVTTTTTTDKDDDNNEDDDELQSQPSIPAIEYMADSMELVGYLGEPLLRGKAQYEQGLNFVIEQLQSNVQNGRFVVVVQENDENVDKSLEQQQQQQAVTTKVEWTSQGTIYYCLSLNLRVALLPLIGNPNKKNNNNKNNPFFPPTQREGSGGRAGGITPRTPSDWVSFFFLGNTLSSNTIIDNTILRSITNDDGSNNNNVRSRGPLLGLGTEFPFQITVQSEFVVDPMTGYIIQQRLMESTINGQLTPADVASRWLQQVLMTTTKMQRKDGSSSSSSGTW